MSDVTGERRTGHPMGQSPRGNKMNILMKKYFFQASDISNY
jgi:hypothetical protein